MPFYRIRAKVEDQINADIQIHSCSDFVELDNDNPNDYAISCEPHLSYIVGQNEL